MDYSRLPEHIRGGVQRYIDHGVPVGSFLETVLCNDLKGAFMWADEINRERLFDIVSFFYNEAPSQCWGSADKVKVWMGHNGLAGLDLESAHNS